MIVSIKTYSLDTINVTLCGKNILADVINWAILSWERSGLPWWALNSLTSVLRRHRRDTQRRGPWGHGGRERSCAVSHKPKMPANTRIRRKHRREPLESLKELRYMQNIIYKSKRSSTKQENTLLRHALTWKKLKGSLLSKTKMKQYQKVPYYRIPRMLLFSMDIYRSNMDSSVSSLCIGAEMGNSKAWQ